ncbi:MAG: S41 family peptidase, partial [Bacteroidota bacterium]
FSTEKKVHYQDQNSNTKELWSINGLKADSLYNAAMSSLGGLPHYKQHLLKKIFFPIYLHLSGINAPFELQFSSGASATLVVSKTISFIDLWHQLKGSSEDYTFEILDGDIAFISYNNCKNYDQFKLFLANTFRKIKAENIKKLIIDIRNNSGGDSSLNDLLLAYLYDKPYRQMSRRLWRLSPVSAQLLVQQGYKEYFGDNYIEEARTIGDSLILEFDIGDGFMEPEQPVNFYDGKSCVLIGPATYSSANMLADAIKEFQISTLIGSATGQWTNDFGEMASFELPHSQLPFTVAMTMDIGASGKEAHFQAVLPDFLVENNVIPFAIDWLEK